MAPLTTNTKDSPQGFRLGLLSAEQEDAGLRFALGQLPEAEFRQNVAMLQASARRDPPSPFGLWGAWRSEELVAALLFQVQPGRTASVWPPTFDADEPIATATQLLKAVVGQFAQSGVRMIQAMLTTDLPREAEPLLATGFHHVSDLLYLVSAADEFPRAVPCPGLEFVPYSPALHTRLARLVEATYEGTLDCPAVNGVREIDDVLLGYRATGQFEPRHWLLVRYGPLDIGCLIVANHPGQDTCELIYMGILPEARGHGWGVWIARHAQWLAGQSGQSRLVLAVDAANEPALRMYAAVGFRAWDQRSVFVKLLHENEPLGQ